MESVGTSLRHRSLAVGLCVAYTLTNVFGAHAGEISFWGERRRAAQTRESTAHHTSDPLYAGLPGTRRHDLRPSPTFEFRPGVGGDAASSLGKAVARSSDSRVYQIAQSILPFGTVRFVRESKKAGAPLVLHIQDVHGNLEAQRNIAEMVLALARDHGVRLVGLEGAWGGFAADEFRPYPDQDSVKKVGRYFLKKELISGAEYAGLASETPMTLWGIEDPALYRANVEAVKQSLAGQVPGEEFLASLTSGLDSLKKIHYSPRLLAFDSNQSLYDQDRRGLGEYLRTLVGFYGGEATDLTVQFPNVVRLLSALNEEKLLDFSAVERERQDLVQVLSKKLSPDEMENLIHQSVDLRAGILSHNAYHIYLRDLCARKEVSLGQKPTLLAYMHYVAASEDIERDSLLKEIASLEISSQEALIETSEQKILVTLSRDALLLKKLVFNEMTPEDWTSYLARKEQTSRFAGRYKSLAPSDQVQWPDNLETFLSPFEAFCARALDRNAALTRNLAKKMAEEKQAVAVLVAGGFHTDGLMEQWAREEASVLVLTPKIGPTDTAHRYLDVFAHDPIPLEKIFTGEPIALKAMCGLSLQDNFREIIDTLHFTVLGVFLKNNSDALLSLRMNTAQIQETLLGIIDNLKVHIFPLAEMDLTVQVGEGNAIALSMTAHNKSRQALFSGRPNEPPIFHMSEPHQENASIRHSTGPSPQTNRPQYSGNKRYARWPGTAIPQFVNFMTGIGISGQQRSILVRANLFQSLLVNLLFFMTVTIFDSTLVDPRILSTGVYLILSGMFSEYNRRVYQFDMDLHRWELGNIPEKGTKNLLELSEFLFNLPLLAFFYSDIKDTSIFGFWPLILVGVSVGLRVGYNLLAHNYNTRESLLNPPAPIMEETSPLIEIILGAYQDGTLKNNRKLIPEGRRAEDLEFELDRISQDTVTKILGNRTFKRTDEITDGPYTAYVSEGFPYTIKIPNQKALASIHMTETELRRQCEVAKNHMGILFAPMTIVRNFPIRSKGRFIPKSFVVVQQKLMGVPSLVEELNRTPSSHVSNPQRFFAELMAQREKQVTDFLAAMEEREITFQKPIQAETDLGILPPNKWVAHRLNGIQSLNPRAHHIVARSNNGDHSSTVWRVHDVCLEEIRTEQRKYLRTLLNGPASPKPHSILSDSTLERFLRWCGLSENNAEFWAKAIIILGIPIAETLLYGWATPTLTTFLPTTPLEAAFIPLLTGFISATAHILLWRIQGEKVFFRDFVSWWFMGTLFSSFFSMKPLNGWQGETPWILSGISHILINSAIVAGTARRLGRVLKWSWLMRLKPGSVIPPAPNIQGSGGLTPPQLLNLRRDILSLLTSDSMPLEVGGERREITYEMGYREFIITVGKGPKFDRWIDDQLAESQMHDENINPFRIIDYMKGKEISHLVTEVIIGGHSVPPKNTGAPLVSPSKESSITALCDTIRGAFESEGTEILNQSFHSRLMDQLSSHSLHNAKDGNNRPSQSLMATAAAVILFELKKYPDRSSQLLTYIKSATTFHEILAINDDVAKTNSVFKSFSIKYDEKVSFPFSEIKLKQYHQNYIHFINTNGISPKDNKESASPAIIAPIRGIGKTEESPVPDVIPLLRQSETVEKFDLNGLLLNGGQSINLDLLFRSFKVAGGRVVPQDVQAYRQFIRKKVRNTWAAPHTQDEWLSSLKTQRWEGVALPGVTLLGKSAEHYAESLRWWVLGELWLAVAGPRDWLNWRFYVVLYRERVLFRHNGGFSKQERLARAASYVALLRASENSVLQTNGKWGGTVAQKFDIDLLHGAVGTTGPEWQSILGRVYDSYNKILEQWTRVSLWGQYVQANKPAGIHIFDVDSLLLDSTYDADKQREVASGLAAVLLAFSNVNLARQVFLVTSAQGVQGSSINNVQLAERLKTKYGGVFERVKDLDLLTQEQVYGLYTREEGNAQPTIHLDPLLAHLKLVRMADSVRFWTHDASHVDRGTLPIQIISILKLAEQLQEFFKRHTFIQTFA